MSIFAPLNRELSAKSLIVSLGKGDCQFEINLSSVIQIALWTANIDFWVGRAAPDNRNLEKELSTRGCTFSPVNTIWGFYTHTPHRPPRFRQETKTATLAMPTITKIEVVPWVQICYRNEVAHLTTITENDEVNRNNLRFWSYYNLIVPLRNEITSQSGVSDS